MLAQHAQLDADVTAGCIEVPRMEATGFGVMKVDMMSRIVGFVEARRSSRYARSAARRWRGMGIYVFDTKL